MITLLTTSIFFFIIFKSIQTVIELSGMNKHIQALGYIYSILLICSSLNIIFFNIAFFFGLGFFNLEFIGTLAWIIFEVSTAATFLFSLVAFRSCICNVVKTTSFMKKCGQDQD